VSDDGLEIEVKFLVENLATVRRRLEGAGGTLSKPRIYERNVRFDTPWESLMLQGKLLRLRQDTVARITFKGEPEETRPSEARIREEIEMEVEDFDTAVAILEKIGFEQVQLYEKYRATFQLDRVEVVLDEMPFGYFVELEGSERAIRSAADVLRLEWGKRILSNYLALMAELKTAHNLPFDDLTFENFANLQATMSDIRDYAG
jgi:adenylate cyclase class 2